MNTDDNSPSLSHHEIKTGDEPMLSNRTLAGLGKRQKAFLSWLSQQDRDVSWKTAWIWMGDRTGYLDGSKASQARMHDYISKSLWGLVSTLLTRRLIVIVEGETGRSIRLLVHVETEENDHA